jgi:predicted RNA-binding Zn ribbon-like protein
MNGARPPAIFLADSAGLDFLNSIAHPGGVAVEWLTSGEDLLAWLEQADLVPADVAAALREDAVPGELDAVAAQARALRAWFRGFVEAHEGRALSADDLPQLARLNQVLGRDESFGQIVAQGGGLVTRTQRRWRSPDALLLPIAQAMAGLVCAEDFSRVKTCEGHGCTLMFIDRTRGKARRWCSMAICGNRAKQAAHRERGHVGAGVGPARASRAAFSEV